MSTFENYDVTSATYTGMRKAVGWNAQLDHFRLNSLPLRQQQLLDAGCGTGNYTVHYARHFGTIKACDFSQGKLGFQQVITHIDVILAWFFSCSFYFAVYFIVIRCFFFQI